MFWLLKFIAYCVGKIVDMTNKDDKSKKN